MVFRCFRDSDELLTRQEFVVGGSHLAAADPLPDSFQMPGKRIGVDGVLTQGEGWMDGLFRWQTIFMLRKVSFDNLIRKLDTGPKECETTEQESEKIWEQLEVSLSPLLIHFPVRGGPNLSSLRDWSLAQMALAWTGRS